MYVRTICFIGGEISSQQGSNTGNTPKSNPKDLSESDSGYSSEQTNNHKIPQGWWLVDDAWLSWQLSCIKKCEVFIHSYIPIYLYTGTRQIKRDPGLIPCKTLATQEDKSGNHTAH